MKRRHVCFLSSSSCSTKEVGRVLGTGEVELRAKVRLPMTKLWDSCGAYMSTAD